MKSKKETRNVSVNTKKMLWGMAAGRCEKAGCNKILYESPVTHEENLIGEMAHNVAHSKEGPRGQHYAIGGRNGLENLILLCPECHKEIDKKPEEYPIELLLKMKQEHEERIRILSDISSERECLTIIYTASIAKDFGYEDKKEMIKALSLLQYYSSQSHRIEISAIKDNIKDGDSIQIKMESLHKLFQARVQPAITDEQRPIAVFALAPIPLLVYLGTLFPTGTKILPFLKLRHDRWNGLSWRYEEGEQKESPFIVLPPSVQNPNHTVALILETTDFIDERRVYNAFPNNSDIDIWHIRHKSPGYDLDCSESVINSWTKTIMKVMNEIRGIYGMKDVNIFPAINNALALTLGIARVEKTDATWAIYDNENGIFQKKLDIRSNK